MTTPSGSGRSGLDGGRFSLLGTALVCACVAHCAATALLAGTVLALGGGPLGGLPVAVTAGVAGVAAMWGVRHRARVTEAPSPGR